MRVRVAKPIRLAREEEPISIEVRQGVTIGELADYAAEILKMDPLTMPGAKWTIGEFSRAARASFCLYERETYRLELAIPDRGNGEQAKHSMELSWSGHSGAVTHYSGSCSCGWRTGFETTEKAHVVEAMGGHAKQVQAELEPSQHEGQYL